MEYPDFGGVAFDGYISINGQYCYRGDQVLYQNTILQEDRAALIRWLEQNGYDAECVKYKEPEVSKTGIGKLIKEGVPVPYASIEQGRSVGVK